MKIMDLQNSFTQIYMFKRDNAEIKKKKPVLVHISQNVLLQQTENVTLVKFNDIKSKPQIKV